MAKNNIRSGQVLSPFGIGQIVNFPEELSLMVCGLNLWDDEIEQRRVSGGINAVDEIPLRIDEPRLQKFLGVDYFRKPFPYKTKGLNNNHLQIPGVRFPGWHYCTSIKCGRMREIELTLVDKKVECPSCKSKMIPVRFVAACQQGHIQDVPFKEWVHNGPVPQDGKIHELTYNTGSGSGDLGSIFIKCSCGQIKSLAGIMNIRKTENNIFDSALARIGLDKDDKQEFSEINKNDNNPSGQYCKGHQPWLGLEGVHHAQPHKAHLQVLIRGGSNIHYSNIISAIYLPTVSESADEYIEKAIKEIEGGIEKLRQYHNQDNSNMLLGIVLENTSVVRSKLITKEALVAGILIELKKNIEEAEIKTVADLRQEEYKYILKGRNSENTDFKALKKTFGNYDEFELLEENFDCVVLIEKLKETRVFTGFSRIIPDNSDRDTKMQQLSLMPIKWLPAYEVYGEGIFIKFKDEKIEQWQKKNEPYFNDLIERYHLAMTRRKPDYERRDINCAFIMMHTFAHLLIKRLCFNCGYGSSSLRERIYFNSSPDNRMNGFLIYTSSGDSEGSLGGLVRQGKANFLGKLIKDSIEDSRWCSADPVCSDIGQSSGQGPDNVNGSACHNCCIVPETSCEEFNTLLDRATIIGTLENPKIGYFTTL